MNNKTLDTALLSLSAGCLVISIYEIMTQGLGHAYIWMMLTLGLWLWYTLRRRRQQAADEAAESRDKKRSVRGFGAKPSSAQRPASKSNRKRK
jgi:cbb3-type cytochrome oxidase subunit 3